VSRRLLLVAGVAVLAVLAGLSSELGRSSSSGSGALPGELAGPAPWPRNAGRLEQRLTALGVPAPGFEGTALHTHQHLDLFVDGKRVVVPAGIGIDPAGRFISPLHTHDTSGVIHVESPTVRPFTLGELFGVWASGSVRAGWAGTSTAAAGPSALTSTAGRWRATPAAWCSPSTRSSCSRSGASCRGPSRRVTPSRPASRRPDEGAILRSADETAAPILPAAHPRSARPERD
jgi:hypothetical protein